jgi:hypothetical protein
MMHSWIDVIVLSWLIRDKMDELQSGPLMVKSLMGRHFTIELSLKYGWRTHSYMWINEMKISEVVDETILDG